MREYLWTLDGGRLQHRGSYGDANINWLFLPGGPGLGSEAILGLVELMQKKISGTYWLFDLPNDGSNILIDKPISNWRVVIKQAASAFEKVILVAHSTPAMYVQTMPELENLLHGCVFIGSAPDASWQKIFESHCKIHSDENIAVAEKNYVDCPNNESLRQLLIAAAKHCFVTGASLAAGKNLFANLPVNYLAHVQAAKSFDSEKYQATWIPKIKTLITTGSNDYITPLSLYKNNHEYQKENIVIREITNAGHYPWFENPQEVIQGFKEWYELMNQE